jgi:hypothetical protein
MTDWSLFFSRFQILITPDEPPDARRGSPSGKSRKERKYSRGLMEKEPSL